MNYKLKMAEIVDLIKIQDDITMYFLMVTESLLEKQLEL